jgi:hypothetical protein
MKKYKAFSQTEKSIHPVYDFIDKCLTIINCCHLENDIKTYENEYLKIISDLNNDNVSVFIKKENDDDDCKKTISLNDSSVPDILIKNEVLRRASSKWININSFIDLILQQSILNHTLKNKEKTSKPLKI